MHELSIVESIIHTVECSVRNHGGGHVENIVVDIGELAAVEIPALKFAWKHATPGTLLDSSTLEWNTVDGLAQCRNCNSTFHASAYYTPCPQCDNVGNDIIEGKDIVIRSISISTSEHPSMQESSIN